MTNTTGTTCGAGSSYLSGAPEIIPSFWLGSCSFKTCHGTCLSQIHVFGFDVIFVILVGFFSDAWSVSVCVSYIVVLCRCSPLIFMRFPKF